MNLVVKNLLTHYERAGQNVNGHKFVLIIPGWADTSASWQNTMNQLSQDFDVVVIDLPGFGGSQMPQQAWGLDEYADFVGQFIRKLDAGDPYAIIGHSNGGAIAMRALSTKAVTCSKLLLIASAGIRGQASGRNQGLKLLAKAGKVLTAPLPHGVKRRLRQKVYQAAGSDMLVAEHMQETFKKVVATDIQADAATLTLPTLLIYGTDDTNTPVSYGQTFNSLIKGSKLEIVPGAGHFVFLDQPDTVLAHMKDFLKS